MTRDKVSVARRRETGSVSSPLDVVADWAAPPEAEALKPYFYDPVGFARDCIRWPEGQGLNPHQEEGLNAIIEHRRLSIRSMHGAGKTTFCAAFILWFALTRDAMCRSGAYGLADWKIVITAGAWRQLEKFLMPEVHKWAQRTSTGTSSAGEPSRRPSCNVSGSGSATAKPPRSRRTTWP